MPNLYDPGEFDIVRKMYFDPPDFRHKDLDPYEALERMEKKRTENNAR